MVGIERSRRWDIWGRFLVAAVVGSALGLRAIVVSFTHGDFVPGGVGPAQMAFGVVVGVLGAVICRRELGPIVGERPRRSVVRLPRRVRRSLHLGLGLPRDVSRQVRLCVPVWLSQQRLLCGCAAGSVIYTWGMWLVVTAGGGGVGEMVRSVVVTGGFMLLPGVPLAVYAVRLGRVRNQLRPGVRQASFRAAARLWLAP